MLTKIMKGLAAGALLASTAMAATGTIQGTIPSESYVIVSSEKSLDFTSPATDFAVATITVNSNAPQWAVKISFDADGLAFNGTGGDDIYSGFGFNGDNSSGFGNALTSPTASAPNNIDGTAAIIRDIAAGALATGDMSCLLTNHPASDVLTGLDGATAITCNTGTAAAYDADIPIYIGARDAATTWGAGNQTTATTNWDLDVRATWASQSGTLLAGTYRQVMTVIMETNI